MVTVPLSTRMTGCRSATPTTSTLARSTPRRVRLRSILRFSLYVPALIRIRQPVGAALIASWILLNCLGTSMTGL
jgi:hypothetical protein